MNNKVKKFAIPFMVTLFSATVSAQSVPVLGEALGGLNISGGSDLASALSLGGGSDMLGGLEGNPLGELIGSGDMLGGLDLVINQGYLILPALGEPAEALANYQAIFDSVLFVAAGPQPFFDAITSGLAGSIVTVLPALAGGDPTEVLDFLLSGGTIVTSSNAFIPPIPIFSEPLELGGL